MAKWQTIKHNGMYVPEDHDEFAPEDSQEMFQDYDGPLDMEHPQLGNTFRMLVYERPGHNRKEDTQMSHIEGQLMIIAENNLKDLKVAKIKFDVENSYDVEERPEDQQEDTDQEPGAVLQAEYTHLTCYPTTATVLFQNSDTTQAVADAAVTQLQALFRNYEPSESPNSREYIHHIVIASD